MGTRIDEERVSAAIAAQIAFIERLGDIRVRERAKINLRTLGIMQRSLAERGFTNVRFVIVF